mmetsp:Transcript_47238/g.87994  ORF Transcript_47238/g.87994 Transcript_47238/m.87994 type:complete len:366 (-) Transcript_47238:42-1139(-)
MIFLDLHHVLNLLLRVRVASKPCLLIQGAPELTLSHGEPLVEHGIATLQLLVLLPHLLHCAGGLLHHPQLLLILLSKLYQLLTLPLTALRFKTRAFELLPPLLHIKLESLGLLFSILLCLLEHAGLLLCKLELLKILQQRIPLFSQGCSLTSNSFALSNLYPLLQRFVLIAQTVSLLFSVLLFLLEHHGLLLHSLQLLQSLFFSVLLFLLEHHGLLLHGLQLLQILLQCVSLRLQCVSLRLQCVSLLPDCRSLSLNTLALHALFLQGLRRLCMLLQRLVLAAQLVHLHLECCTTGLLGLQQLRKVVQLRLLIGQGLLCGEELAAKLGLALGMLLLCFPPICLSLLACTDRRCQQRFLRGMLRGQL